jgi:hypothetical protein
MHYITKFIRIISLVPIVSLMMISLSSCSGQKWSKFNCDESGKCLGIKFSIKYPTNWEKMDGDHPHIIINFGHEEKRGYVKMVIYLNKFDETPTQLDINRIYSKDYIFNNFKVNKLIEFNNKAKIEDERCVFATIQVEDQMYDQTVRSIVKTNLLIWKDYLFQINFFIFSNDQSFETMSEMYNDYNNTFKEMMVSLAILSKWEN